MDKYKPDSRNRHPKKCGPVLLSAAFFILAGAAAFSLGLIGWLLHNVQP